MKRPLVWLGAAFLLFIIMLYQTGSRIGDSPCDMAGTLLEEMAEADETITVRGTVAACSAVSAGLRLSVNHLTIQRKESSYFTLQSDLKLNITTKNGGIEPGDTILAEGTFAAYETATNPGQFDLKSYYAAQNTVGLLKDAVITVTQPSSFSLSNFAYRLRRLLRDSYTRILPEKAARTAAAITLGEKGWMEQEWKDVYQEGGIAHILAISGLHISLVGMSIYRLLRRIGACFGVSAFVAGALLSFYVLMTEFSISSVRALLMFLVWLGAQICGRKYDMATGIAVAAVLLAGQDARNISQSSFLLSFSAILSLMIFIAPLTQSCRIRTAAGKALSVSAAVWFGMLPCTLYFFYQASPWSILVNLAVIPLMPVVMGCALAASFLGLLSVQAGIFLSSPVQYLLSGFEWLCSLEQHLPAAVWVAGKPAVSQILLYYAVLFSVLAAVRCSGRKRQPDKTQETGWRGRLLWLGCGTVCIFWMGFHPRSQLSIDCLDVGQGDCTVVRLPSGENCLIDGGSSSRRTVWQYVIEPAVKSFGIRSIDYIFLSHADLDHVNGITEYLESYREGFGGTNAHGVSVKHLVLPPCMDDTDFDKLKALVSEKGIELLRMEAGAVIAGKDWEIRAVSPSGDTLTGDKNEDSLVLMLSYGKFQMLFTGDLEGGTEKKLAEAGKDLQADVLKAGHHGSAGASSREFLRCVQPKLAVVSCGRDNPYGHPSQETLRRLEEAGADILVTARCGAVEITVDGERFAVKVQENMKNLKKN